MTSLRRNRIRRISTDRQHAERPVPSRHDAGSSPDGQTSPHETTAAASAASFTVKRGLDFTLGSLMLALLSPVFALVSLAIRLDSKGPALFVQTRAGAEPKRTNGQIEWERNEFTVYKFRSMYAVSYTHLRAHET